MADKKISQLPSATTPLVGTEELPLVQSGVTKKVTASNFLLPSNIGSTVQAYDVDTTKNDLSNTFTQPQIFPAGTVSAPSITTTGDTNTGVFFPAADTVAVTIGGAEIARAASGRFVVGSTTPYQLFGVAGGGLLQKYVGSIATGTPTQILMAAGFPTNANRASVYKVNVVATIFGAATRVREFIWICQVFQSSGSRTLTQIYDYEANLNASVRRLDFTVTASKSSNDEILTIDVSSSGTSAPTEANVIVYAEAYGGRDGTTNLLS